MEADYNVERMIITKNKQFFYIGIIVGVIGLALFIAGAVMLGIGIHKKNEKSSNAVVTTVSNPLTSTSTSTSSTTTTATSLPTSTSTTTTTTPSTTSTTTTTTTTPSTTVTSTSPTTTTTTTPTVPTTTSTTSTQSSSTTVTTSTSTTSPQTTVTTTTGSTTTPNLSQIFNNLTTTTASTFSPCNSWVAFVGDASNSIPSLDYTKQNDFISTAISEFNHPELLSFQNGIDSEIPWLSGFSLDKIRFYISTSTKNPNLPLRLRTMLYVLYEMIQSLSAIPSPMAAIVFVSDTSNPEIYRGADQPANLLNAINVKLTIVLVGTNANQANLVNLTDNFIFWRNLTNPRPENWENLRLSAYNCPTF